MTVNICDLSRIYNSEYQYSLPRDVLESFLTGKAFDNKKIYAPEEFQALCENINRLFANIMASNPVRKCEAVITAGAPGAGKTTLLEQLLQKKAEEGEIYSYVCPDATCLVNLDLYNADIARGIDPLTAYNKWRPASNAAAHLIVANLVLEKYALYFGSTSTSPMTGKFFSFLQKQGYSVHLVHLSASDEVRFTSIRGRSLVQTTLEEVKSKGESFPERLADTYWHHANKIDFYYRQEAGEDAVLAASLVKGESVGVINLQAYEAIGSIHNESVLRRGMPHLLWETVIPR
jgi:hypothetical protein